MSERSVCSCACIDENEVCTRLCECVSAIRTRVCTASCHVVNPKGESAQASCSLIHSTDASLLVFFFFRLAPTATVSRVPFFLHPVACCSSRQPRALSATTKAPAPRRAGTDTILSTSHSLCERNECRIWRGRGGWCKCKRQWIQKLLKWLGFSPPHPRCPVCRQEAVK